MGTEYQFIIKEIPVKGEAYLLLKRAEFHRAVGLLEQAAREAQAQGAVRLLVASVDPTLPLAKGSYGGVRLEHIHDMHLLERSLEDSPPPWEGLVLAPLKAEQAGEWLALYNLGFLQVPNSATYEAVDLQAAQAEGRQCGFALAEGAAVGVYELDPLAQPPEIAGIALNPAFRGQGLGRALLRAVLTELSRREFHSCRLTVSTANQTAYGLYLAEGFQFVGLKSQWFQVILTE